MGGQIFVFQWVGAMVVELLGAIRFAAIPGVAVTAIGEGMVAELVGRQGGMIPLHLRVLQQWHKAAPFVLRIRREPAQLDQRGIHIEQVDDTIALNTGGCHAGHADHERHAVRLFPQIGFAVFRLLAQMPAVVAPEHEDRVVGVLALLQCIEQHTQAVVHVADVGEVGTLCLLVHVGFVDRVKRAN